MTLSNPSRGVRCRTISCSHCIMAFRSGGRLIRRSPECVVEAIYKQTDDGIFFGVQLCQELSEHGDRLAASFKKQFGKGAPRIAKPDFSKAKDAGLISNDGDYADWFNMFVKRKD